MAVRGIVLILLKIGIVNSTSNHPVPYTMEFTDLIWRKGTPFEAMTGRTAPSPDVS